MELPFDGVRPRIDASAWIATNAVVVGDVTVGAESSIWFNAVVRGDVERIRIGARSNVQDNATIHVTTARFSTTIGDGVTIGHNAVVHGCVVEDDCLVGIGAIVLDGAIVRRESLIGAGAVVTPGTEIPPRSLVLGSPGRRVRELSADELARVCSAAATYVSLRERYRGLA